MGYGKLNQAQRRAVTPHLVGKTVHDLGAGDLELARECLSLGAGHVVAIDKERNFSLPRAKITKLHMSFAEFNDPAPTVILSWPVNHPAHGLLRLVKEAETVVYLGTNTDGMACGTKPLWKHLATRKVLAHVPVRENTLIVYGALLGKSRKVLPEEYAALNTDEIYSFDSLYGPNPVVRL